MEIISVEPPPAAHVEEVLRTGIRSYQQADWQTALGCFDTVARWAPHRNDVHNHRARTYERLGRFGEALECLERALAIDPRNIADWGNRGIVLKKLGQAAEAVESFERVLALDPNDVAALTQRALLLNELGQRTEALASIDQAVRTKPDHLDVLNARVIILDNLGRYTEGLHDLDRMLGICATHLDAINNTGMLLARLGRFEEALRCYDRSLALQPDQPQARYNRSLVRLSLGDWTRGLLEFESRWATPSLRAAAPVGPAPQWRGQESLEGKTVLVYHEQGYGDTLMSARYIPLLAQRGARVILVVPPALERLMRTVSGVSEVTSQAAGWVHHYQVPLMSLLGAFSTTPETIPAAIPYVSADPSLVSHWAQRLGTRTKPRIGLVWGGRRYAPINYPRDVPLQTLKPLLALDAQFIALQKDGSAEDRAVLGALPQMQWVGDQLEDFADTAALIANLDLVIAADTAVAHLAGALGKPVWLMNRFASCWRWLQGRSDSPWYPTLRQFRQPRVGDWQSVVNAVASALRELTTTSVITASEALPISAAATAVVRTPQSPREKIRLVCATRGSKADFFATSPLGRSLPAYQRFPRQQAIELRLFAENRAGLPEVYNVAIAEAETDPAILVFLHDDIYLSDFYWAEHLQNALRSFDIVGLVGNRRRLPGQVSWMYLDERWTSDSYDYFSGVLGHGDPFPNLKQLSVYGEPGLEVKLLDGVFLAADSRKLIERDLRFDPRFQFHFYDMDFCRQAELRRLTMGTCAMSVVHASAGELGGEGWQAGYREYQAKYGNDQALCAQG